MGKATRLKQEEAAQAEADFQQNFLVRSREVAAKLAVAPPPIQEDFKGYEGFFVRDTSSFQLKTKSKDRNKQRLEFIRHALHVYPVPAFMFEAWTEYKAPYIYRNFALKEDYRLWYICMATGGSFYKEYGSWLFTKKECHIFLNCKQDVTIEQAITYAIAYAECGNMGRSLRIAKSRLNTLTSLPYWREVIRFFAREEPKSVEQIDDTVDYIRHKLQENKDFTIIGKGHTLKSLAEKVEKWHQDLRRLKLIGEHVWAGIDAPDREYTQKNYDGSVDTWKFTQIKNAKDLQREGNAMRHCVLSYKNACISGQSSIWSMTLNGNRKLTIEVNKSGIVMQVRGLANRIARKDERNVVSKWARDSRFGYPY